jgi:hypothetical protein
VIELSNALGTKATFDDIWLKVKVDIAEVDCDAENTNSNRNANKDDAGFTEVKTVHDSVDEWKRFEKNISKIR